MGVESASEHTSLADLEEIRRKAGAVEKEAFQREAFHQSEQRKAIGQGEESRRRASVAEEESRRDASANDKYGAEHNLQANLAIESVGGGISSISIAREYLKDRGESDPAKHRDAQAFVDQGLTKKATSFESSFKRMLGSSGEIETEAKGMSFGEKMNLAGNSMSELSKASQNIAASETTSAELSQSVTEMRLAGLVSKLQYDTAGYHLAKAPKPAGLGSQASQYSPSELQRLKQLEEGRESTASSSSQAQQAARFVLPGLDLNRLAPKPPTSLPEDSETWN